MNRDDLIRHIEVNQERICALINYLDEIVSELREDISKIDIRNQALLQELQMQEKKAQAQKKSSHTCAREDFCLTPMYIRVVKNIDSDLP